MEGLCLKSIKRDKHPMWFPPAAVEKIGNPQILLMNSLTETIEPFAPKNGKIIKWYTCGPTVYDVCHMGHARAYLTFDIMRRIMEDYFGYTVIYHINITDVDDKIIKRARINKLIENLKIELNGSLDELTKLVKKSTDFSQILLSDLKLKLSFPIENNGNSRSASELEEKLKELALKEEQINETIKKIEASSQNFDSLFIAAAPFLSDYLDSERGSLIIDNNVFTSHAKKYENSFMEDMSNLGIREPDVITRVTDYIPDIVKFINTLVEKGFAYQGKTSIYFDTEAFIAAGHSYPKLKGTSGNSNLASATEEEMNEGEGILTKIDVNEKKNPNDFALWKFSKLGEPQWESPWGPGRPGWHIECSVVASDVLGDNIDIHSGGWDLKFPHHDNECAQSEAFHGNQQWVNYFLHCGHLHIKGLKMSKSLKNFITIQQALTELEITSRQMRLLFLLNDWGKPMNFSDQSLGSAKEVERILRAFFGSVEVKLRKKSSINRCDKEDKDLLDKCIATQENVDKAFFNNLNTPVAMQEIMDLVNFCNQYLIKKEATSSFILRKVVVYITRILKIFGVIQGNDDFGFNPSLEQKSTNDNFNSLVDALVVFRDQIRSAANASKPYKEFFSCCDFLRDDLLPPLGIRLEDKPGGEPTIWKTDDPKLLMKEISDRRKALEDDRRLKLKNQLETKRKEYEKYLKFSTPPEVYFKKNENHAYSAYDDNGIPIKDAHGNEIPEKSIQKMKKELSKYVSQRDAIMAKEKENNYYSNLKREMDKILSQLHN